MKSKLLRIMVLIIIMSLLIGMSTMVFANNEDLGSDVIDGIQGKKGNIMGEGALNTISKLSNDIFNIVRYIVIAVLVIKAFSMFAQFSSAGDQPQVKAALKTKLLWAIIGLLLALNFWSIYGFIAKAIQISFD